MKVYDKAHQLAHAMKNNDAYQQLKRLHDKIVCSPEKKALLDEFESIQKRLHQKEVSGREITEHDKRELQKSFTRLNKDELIKEYFEVELQVNQMMADIYKILSEAIDLEK